MAVALTPGLPGPAARRWRLLTIALAVGLVHVWIAGRVADTVLEAGRAATMPPRLQVAFVRELQPAPPPAPPPVAAAPPARAAPAPAAGRVAARRVVPPSPAASAPPAAVPPPAEPAVAPEPPAPASTEPPVFEIDASMAREPGDDGPTPGAAQPIPPIADLPPADPLAPGQAELPAADGTPAAAPAAAAPAASVAGSAASAAAPEDSIWPPSTRLSYTLTGHYRGPVEGSAQVEWLRDGLRYQMHLDVIVGPGFAPLMSRRMSSEGSLGAEGLVPERYDEQTQRAFTASRQLTMRFGPGDIQLASGRRVPRPAAVQDTASQFGQITWLFTREPQRLVTGAQITLPLALPRRVDDWVFDVLPPETLYTPFGAIEAFLLKPRPPARPSGELMAQMWIAPTLQYLPVRIRIQQDEETWIDLMVDSAPLQARR